MKRLFLVIAVLALSARAGAAQTPEAAAERYLAAMQAGDWDATAAMMHPAALSELQGLFEVLADADSAGTLLQPVFGVANADEYHALTGEQVYARLLAMVSRTAPQLVQSMRGMRTHVIGSVAEGADTAHVVYRLTVTVDGIPASKTDVLTLGRSGDRWMTMLSGPG